MDDVRWQQRLGSYLRAFRKLDEAVVLVRERQLSDLERLGLVQAFEFTHELAWNLLKDYLTDQGIAGLIGSRDATRAAFRNALVTDGEAWMDMIQARNLTSHTYNEDVVQGVAADIASRFHPALLDLRDRFTAILAREDGTR